MPFGVPDAFLLHVFFQRIGKVNACLICQAYQNKKHIGHFIG